MVSARTPKDYPPADLPEVAFAGRSNVGKSSLINTLVNRRGLAKTSSRPGRTQAINFFLLNGKLYLVDLPGYGFAKVPVKIKKSWRNMVETYLKTRSNLKGVVVILDVRRGADPDDVDLLNWLAHHGIRSLVVVTKVDKVSRSRAREAAKGISSSIKEVYPGEPLLFSAKTREGREELWQELEEICFGAHLPPPESSP